MDNEGWSSQLSEFYRVHAELANRTFDFIARHNLKAQFDEEENGTANAQTVVKEKRLVLLESAVVYCLGIRSCALILLNRPVDSVVVPVNCPNLPLDQFP